MDGQFPFPLCGNNSCEVPELPNLFLATGEKYVDPAVAATPDPNTA